MIKGYRLTNIFSCKEGRPNYLQYLQTYLLSRISLEGRAEKEIIELYFPFGNGTDSDASWYPMVQYRLYQAKREETRFRKRENSERKIQLCCDITNDHFTRSKRDREQEGKTDPKPKAFYIGAFQNRDDDCIQSLLVTCFSNQIGDL